MGKTENKTDVAAAEEINWKIMQAYVNEALKKGVMRYSEQIIEARERSRKYRSWLIHRKKKAVAAMSRNWIEE